MSFTVVNVAGDPVPVDAESCTTVKELRKCIATSLGVHVLQLKLVSHDAELEDCTETCGLEGAVTVIRDDFLTQLLGHWANIDETTGGMIGYSFGVSAEGQLLCAGYGKCCPTWSVSVFPALLTEDGFQMEANHGFKIEMVSGKLHEDGKLYVAESKRFTDKSGRFPQETEYTMTRIPGNLDNMEEHLTSTFYGGRGGGFDRVERDTWMTEFD